MPSCLKSACCRGPPVAVATVISAAEAAQWTWLHSARNRYSVAGQVTRMEDRPIILLDEPFSALDAKTRTEMRNLAVELLSERTALQITHDPAEAGRIGETICWLKRSGMVSIGQPDGNIPRDADDSRMPEFQGMLCKQLLEAD